MREGLLLGGVLTNSESWINVTTKNVEELEKPDTILQRKVLSSTGNPSKVFMMLELGLIPIRVVLMQKRLQLLHYFLNQGPNSMLKQVFEALKKDSRKGDFINLTDRDINSLNLNMNHEEIQVLSKCKWKGILKQKTTSAAISM